MDQIKDLLKLQLGESLAKGNWESHVYELGDEWVYKEVKQPSSVDKTIENYESRQLLQEFWNSEVHFQNMVHDYKVFNSKIGKFLPETFFLRNKSLIDQSSIVTISIQEKLSGTLLNDIDYQVPQLKELAKLVRELCEQVFSAPSDFHSGNLLLTDDGKLFFFDTGTPSDWDYFLNPEKMADVLGSTLDRTFRFTEFMKPIHEKHWQKLIEASES